MKTHLTRKEFLALAASGLGLAAAGPLVILAEKAIRERKKVAVVDRDRCLAWDADQPCSDCADACASEAPAMQWKPVTLILAGQEVTLQRPVVQADLCAGCGACAASCPSEVSAIRLCE